MQQLRDSKENQLKRHVELQKDLQHGTTNAQDIITLNNHKITTYIFKEFTNVHSIYAMVSMRMVKHETFDFKVSDLYASLVL